MTKSATDDLNDAWSDFVHSDQVQLAQNLLIFFLIVLWLALAFWTFRDARRRIDDWVIVSVATLGALCFPFVGALIYSIVRPPEYLDDVHARELEIQVLEAQLMRERALARQAMASAGHPAMAPAAAPAMATPSAPAVGPAPDRFDPDRLERLQRRELGGGRPDGAPDPRDLQLESPVTSAVASRQPTPGPAASARSNAVPGSTAPPPAPHKMPPPPRRRSRVIEPDTGSTQSILPET